MEQCSSFLPINSLATLKKRYLLKIVLPVTASCQSDSALPPSLLFTVHPIRLLSNYGLDFKSNRIEWTIHCSVFNV